ncbi:MAG TPA: DUF3108 domain-containing protein [Gemmatimonadaceae bacterium]|nr:DUF3108 domain-containing protein [Gemmatimonadaceae bacterium]
MIASLLSAVGASIFMLTSAIPGAAPAQTPAQPGADDTVSVASDDSLSSSSTSSHSAIARPFAPGEQLDYMVAVGGAKVGTGQMKLIGIEDVRGEDAYHARFTVEGGFLLFKVNDVLESWFDTETLSSRRFIQNIHEVNYKKNRYYDIYPERGVLHQKGYDEMPTVEKPLDDAAFLYFVRTVPLEVGKTYTFNRYFRPDRNPVIVKVLRKETVEVPAGKFNTVVIQPLIKSQGIFAEGGEAQMWLTDDDRHMMVQFKAKVPYLKTLDMYLSSYKGTIPVSGSH